jgi:hypothetical protein
VIGDEVKVKEIVRDVRDKRERRIQNERDEDL